MDINCAKYIRETRHEMGLTQEQFARLLGVKRYNLARYETGAVIPPGNIVLLVMANNGKKVRKSRQLSK